MSFRNELAEFVYYRTYSRWSDKENKRERWEETVDRYIKNVITPFDNILPQKIKKEIREQILKMGVMPSMRAMWSAGEAMKRNNLCLYNCSYLPILDLDSFAELLYVLCCGTGVGFSVENENIKQLPEIKLQSSYGLGIHIVQDSKEGWADSLKAGLNAWFDGHDIEFDYTQVRKRGARLITMGGRASGFECLRDLHVFARKQILEAQGRKLTSLECHDICCKIAEVVVVGGVRRSSLISFSDLQDELMLNAKNPPIPNHRFMSNNSAVYKTKPDSVTFMREWYNLAKSNSGERGIFNVSNLSKYAPRRSFNGNERANPCLEAILKPYGLCNLSEVVIRASDSFDDMIDKIRVAVWLGAIQSTYIDFKYVRKDFAENCNKERLLGVSLTGQMDNPKLLTEEKLEIAKEYAIKTAKKASLLLDINLSAAITGTKPSGTVSILVDSASGVHPRYAPYYIRRVRISSNDPLYHMMKDQGVKFEPEIGQIAETATTFIVSFPIKSPKNSITRHNMSAKEQLDWYLKVQNNWSEHNVSTTIYVKDSEWLEIGDYVYKNFDNIVGVSFLPYSGGIYELAPYEEITEKEYEILKKEMPEIDYSQLPKYELEDNTTGARTLACTGDKCDI